MEHRLGCRMTLSIPVEIWRGDSVIGSGVSINLSHGGTCIEGIDVGIRPGDFVSVKVFAQNVYHLKAMVLHQSGSLVGLMWASDEQAFHDEIDAIRHGGSDVTSLNTRSSRHKTKLNRPHGLLKNTG